MSDVYDIGIIGVGVAGSFACYKLAKDYKDLKVIAIDLGRPPAKRRRQIEGFLGCLPNSDGKFYLSNIESVSNLVGLRKAKSSYTQLNKVLSNINDFSVTEDRSINVSTEKKLKKIGYSTSLNDYIQVYPKDIHSLSKFMADVISEGNNITYSFDNEVKSVYKQKNIFCIVTELGEYQCKKLIVAVGRSGWRWVRDLYSNFGIIESNDIAKFGIRVEMNATTLKDFNKSSCTLIKPNEVEIGPFSWYGTVIPEDHVDVAISAFRSNENRWKTDKVSFSLIGYRPFPDSGFEQTDRISKLTFILANDRVVKDRVANILTDKGKISLIKEYAWLKDTLQELSYVIPEIINKAYYHVPTITPSAPKINIGTNLESEIEGMFVVGESAGINGLLAAATMGLIVADNVSK